MDRSSLFAKLQREGKFMSKNNQMKKELLGASVPFAGRGGKIGKKRKRNAGVSLDAKFNIDWTRCLHRLPPLLPPIDRCVSCSLPSSVHTSTAPPRPRRVPSGELCESCMIKLCRLDFARGWGMCCPVAASVEDEEGKKREAGSRRQAHCDTSSRKRGWGAFVCSCRVNKKEKKKENEKRNPDRPSFT